MLFCSCPTIIIVACCWLAFRNVVDADSPTIANGGEFDDIKDRRRRADNYRNCSTEYESQKYKNENSKSILLKLYTISNDNPRLTANSTWINEVQYWHGKRYYGKTADNKQICQYKLGCVYPYEDNEAVTFVMYECATNSTEYCCELECCSTTIWVLRWYVGIPLLVTAIVVVIAGTAFYIWRKRVQNSDNMNYFACGMMG